MEDNTPSLKVQEAHTHKSGKLIPRDYVGAWFTSHNPTPKRASHSPRACFTAPSVPSDVAAALLRGPWEDLQLRAAWGLQASTGQSPTWGCLHCLLCCPTMQACRAGSGISATWRTASCSWEQCYVASPDWKTQIRTLALNSAAYCVNNVPSRCFLMKASKSVEMAVLQNKTNREEKWDVYKGLSQKLLLFNDWCAIFLSLEISSSHESMKRMKVKRLLNKEQRSSKKWGGKHPTSMISWRLAELLPNPFSLTSPLASSPTQATRNTGYTSYSRNCLDKKMLGWKHLWVIGIGW